MGFICPTCGKECSSEDNVRQHFLACWKQKNPKHESVPAPRSEDITVINRPNDVMEFFARLNNGRKND